MKKAFLLVFLVLFVSCTAAMAEDNSNEETSKSIDEFRGYSWGTSFDDIMASEITEEMEPFKDYKILEDLGSSSTLDVDNVSVLILLHSEVAGYEAEVRFYFYKDELMAGSYDVMVDNTQEDDAYRDLLAKYTSVYGQPFIARTDSGWGPFTLWVDADKQFVYLDGFMNIEYSYMDAPYVSEVLRLGDEEKYFHVNIEEEINKIGNVDGI